MSHRLLPTIVFASTSLLACGGQVDVRPDPELPETGPPPPAPDASAPADVGVPPVDAGADVHSDVRLCEPGWPTTKGQICTFDAGIECCTHSFDSDGGITCCARGDQ